ncbi:MAG TPA: Ig domain-containing protein, partial [Burkholderiaceae bacterium]|nr:Ig domain-containing protein [Burkholderiaceae bacterium]
MIGFGMGARWAAVCLALALIAGCGSSDEDSCSGTVFYNSYSYGGVTDAEVGQPYSYTPNIQISGCRPSDRIAAGVLPPGLNLDSGSGRISGVPTQGGSYTLTVRPNAEGSVQATFTIRVYPMGLQVPVLSAQRVGVSADLPTSQNMSIAAVNHGGGWVLYSGLARSIGGGTFQLFASTDMGAHWSAATQVGAPSFHPNAVLRVAGGPRDLYVFDSGVQSLLPALYRYDGAAWHVVNNTLPFRSGTGAGFSIDTNGT